MQSRTILITILIFASCLCHGQGGSEKISKGGVGLTMVPFGKSTVFAAPEDEKEGRGVYNYANRPYFAGQLYAYSRIKKNTRLIIGFGYSKHEIYITEDYPGGPYYYKNNIEVFSIPVYVKKTIFNYIYMTYGGMVNFEKGFLDDNVTRRTDMQTGIGLMTSLGVNCQFKSGITVYAGPSGFIYSVIPSFIFKDLVAGLGAEIGMSIDL